MTVHIFPSFDIAVATIGGGSGSGCAGHSCGAVPCKMQKMRLAVGCGLSRSGKILTEQEIEIWNPLETGNQKTTNNNIVRSCSWLGCCYVGVVVVVWPGIKQIGNTLRRDGQWR